MNIPVHRKHTWNITTRFPMQNKIDLLYLRSVQVDFISHFPLGQPIFVNNKKLETRKIDWTVDSKFAENNTLKYIGLNTRSHFNFDIRKFEEEKPAHLKQEINFTWPNKTNFLVQSRCRLGKENFLGKLVSSRV